MSILRRILLIIPIVLGVISMPALAINSKSVPGGIVSFTVQSNTPPSGEYNGQPIMVKATDKPDQWQIVVGIPLWVKPGDRVLTLDDGQTLPFTVSDHKYPEQHITLKTNKHVNLSKENLERHKGEKARATAVYKSFSQGNPVLNFIKPTEGPYSSAFGLKRFYNGEPRSPHSGVDIAAPTGTPIIAPSPGKVVITDNFFFNGNVVYLDHGQGLISMFCHMDSITVKEGQVVKTGDQLGTVGATGRVTGPHLHWSVSLNNARIDPKLLLTESN